MKSVTEFATFSLNQGLKAKASLSAEGKSPEEIQQNLGETFKMEGDRLKHFINALDVAGTNMEKLLRVSVLSLNEGESAPAKAVKVEEHYYVPVFMVTAQPAAAKSEGGRGGKGGRGGGGRGGGGGDKKGSPWGLSPEDKAAKKGGGAGKAGKPS